MSEFILVLSSIILVFALYIIFMKGNNNNNPPSNPYANVKIPASFIPFILVTAIRKKSDVNALSPVPKIFHIKLLLKFFSFSTVFS